MSLRLDQSHTEEPGRGETFEPSTLGDPLDQMTTDAEAMHLGLQERAQVEEVLMKHASSDIDVTTELRRASVISSVALAAMLGVIALCPNPVKTYREWKASQDQDAHTVNVAEGEASIKI